MDELVRVRAFGLVVLVEEQVLLNSCQFVVFSRLFRAVLLRLRGRCHLLLLDWLSIFVDWDACWVTVLLLQILKKIFAELVVAFSVRLKGLRG